MSTLSAAQPGLVLHTVEVADAHELHALTQRNATHLTRHGDFRDEVSASVSDVEARIVADRASEVLFGVRLDDELVGLVELVAVDPPRYGLGFWLDERYVGRGIATSAVGRLLDHARTDLGALDVYAGVTHGNDRSEAVLKRLGFEPIADLATYRRYHRRLRSDVPPGPEMVRS